MFLVRGYGCERTQERKNKHQMLFDCVWFVGSRELRPTPLSDTGAVSVVAAAKIDCESGRISTPGGSNPTSPKLAQPPP